MGSEVVIPESVEGAVEAFGDGRDVTVIGGGTIVMVLANYGWLRAHPSRTLMLHKAGLSYVRRSGSTITIGSTTPISELLDLPAPLGTCAANIGDPEIRAQATLGGNLCAPTPPEHPSGDLQGPLLALGATVRSVGAGGERTEPVEEFLPHREERLVLDVSFDEPAAGACAFLDRPHSRHFTALAVSGVRTPAGEVRLAATGAGPTGRRLPSAESVEDPEAAGMAALHDVELADDALASAWYRERTLPLLVGKVLEQIKEAS